MPCAAGWSIATSALAVVLLVAGAAVVLVQRAFLVARLDTQLAALAQNPRAILLASARAEAAGTTPPPASPTSGSAGCPPTAPSPPVLTPQADPALVPQLTPGEKVSTPQGRATASGEAPAGARRDRDPAERARRRRCSPSPRPPRTSPRRGCTMTLALVGLVVAAVVGLLLWWVDRLGLRPIAEMTDAADAIAAGDTTRRVPPGPPGTEAARLGEALNAMIDTNAATQERMRRFVADASHELRTPLTTLQGYAALHTGAGRPTHGRDRPGGRRDGRRDAPDGRRGGTDAAPRRRAARPGPARRPRRAGARAGRPRGASCATWRRTCASWLLTASSPSRPRRRWSSPATATGLTQALVGLTSNAVRTRRPAPGVADPGRAAGAVRVDVARCRRRHPGRAPGARVRTFPPGRPGHGRRASGGTGLGLAIVDAIARAHGGSASATSQPGRGSTFSLTLPR